MSNEQQELSERIIQLLSFNNEFEEWARIAEQQRRSLNEVLTLQYQRQLVQRQGDSGGRSLDMTSENTDSARHEKRAAPDDSDLDRIICLYHLAKSFEGRMPAIAQAATASPPVIEPVGSRRATIENGDVIIRFPISTLQNTLNDTRAMHKLDTRYRVINSGEFAKEFVRALNREDEDGTTLIHKMADQAFIGCIETGALGIQEHKDQPF